MSPPNAFDIYALALEAGFTQVLALEIARLHLTRENVQPNTPTVAQAVTTPIEEPGSHDPWAWLYDALDARGVDISDPRLYKLTPYEDPYAWPEGRINPHVASQIRKILE